MYQNKYYITKNSGTYAETLEIYGLAKVLAHIFESNNIYNSNIRIKDEGGYYCVSASIPIAEEMVNKTPYFDAYPYIKVKGDKKSDLPGWVIDYEKEQEIASRFYKWAKGRNKEEIAKYDMKPNFNYDLISSIVHDALSAYHKVFNNLYLNKESFNIILKEILKLYSSPRNNEEKMKQIINKSNFSKINALQLFNPHQGKGVNTPKANGIGLKNISVLWIKEYLKIIGFYESMIIKNVKGTKDSKYYVIEPYNIDYFMLSKIYKDFKPLINANTPFKMDIVLVLLYTKKLIEYLPEFKEGKPFFSRRLKPINLVQGFRTAYQKKLSQFSSAITNIGYLRLPEFVEIDSFAEGQKWVKIINEHIEIIKHIDESNSSTTSLLQHYRQFLSTGSWNEFFEFYFGYATLLMRDIEERKMYLKAFTIKNLKEVFMTEGKFKPILESPGFQNIAKAIRNATINEQYAKANGKQRFDIHYGMAHELKRKSPYKKDLVEFLSEFIASYNAETARYVEDHSDEFKAGKVRATVKTEDVEEVISLIDEYGASVVGKLLAAYGYALERKEGISEDSEEK